MKVNKILEFLNGKFPVDTACDFDNVGLLVGDGEVDVSNVLISLDCTLETVETAKNNKCELIITHHPVIFSPLKNVLKGSVVYKLIENNISVISMHTNLDVGMGGVNSSLCDAIGLENVEFYPASDGYILQKGSIKECSADDLAEHLKKRLNTVVKYVDGGKPIKNVLVCSGSGGDFIYDAIKGGFDALVTSDIKHHQFLEAEDNGVSLFECGHFNTEDVVVEPLCELLKDKFKDIKFITTHKTSIKYK